MISRRGVLGMLIGGGASTVVVRDRKPQKNNFVIEDIKYISDPVIPDSFGIRYKCRGVKDGLYVNKRCGLILTPEAGTKAWGHALKNFGEMLIKHSDHNYMEG